MHAFLLVLAGAARMLASDLPAGSAPAPVDVPQFPDRMHAFVWRNWPLVPVERIAAVLGARREDVVLMGRAMGLGGPPRISVDLRRRSYLTVIRRNWHLVPYEQLLDLLEWTPERLAFTLREDDFLYAKLGSLKPRCERLVYAPPGEAALRREREIARVVREAFPDGPGRGPDPLFGFVKRLSAPPDDRSRPPADPGAMEPRFCYSYFAPYGDPLIGDGADPYPDGYLVRLAATGVSGVWLQGVLYKLAPFPWDPALSEGWERRLSGLRAMVRRAGRHGIGIYLYMNEPRAMPVGFFASRPELRGVTEGDHATLCTSVPGVREYLSASVERLCRAVPGLAGIFTITASENLTSCWSHYQGAGCPRCAVAGGPTVVAGVNAAIAEGIRRSGSATRLIAWDWGWTPDWIDPIARALPAGTALMSVSEWDLPIRRGSVEATIGEYSVSEVGPGPRARRTWEAARRHALPTVAKIQAANSWELSAVPYIPALSTVARHVANLKAAGVGGLMLGWTLGGYPSPNLEVAASIARGPAGDDAGETARAALRAVSERRFGPGAAPRVRAAWDAFSRAMGQFPYHIGVVYNGPQQVGPANPLWERPTGYTATMVGFPYDDPSTWRAVYPPEVFAGQLERTAEGFRAGLTELRAARAALGSGEPAARREALEAEERVAEACAIHFQSAAHQARFVLAREEAMVSSNPDAVRRALNWIEAVLRGEMDLAIRMHTLQTADSRIGFEASNQYYYVPLDLVEKVVVCRDLLERWLPAERERLRDMER